MEMAGKYSDHYFYLFLEKNEKCLELLDLARKLIEKSFQKKRFKKKVLRIAWFGEKVDQTILSPPRHVRQKISASVDGGPSGGSRVRRPGSEDPHRR